MARFPLSLALTADARFLALQTRQTQPHSQTRLALHDYCFPPSSYIYVHTHIIIRYIHPHVHLCLYIHTEHLASTPPRTLKYNRTTLPSSLVSLIYLHIYIHIYQYMYICIYLKYSRTTLPSSASLAPSVCLRLHTPTATCTRAVGRRCCGSSNRAVTWARSRDTSRGTEAGGGDEGSRSEKLWSTRRGARGGWAISAALESGVDFELECWSTQSW